MSSSHQKGCNGVHKSESGDIWWPSSVLVVQLTSFMDIWNPLIIVFLKNVNFGSDGLSSWGWVWVTSSFCVLKTGNSLLSICKTQKINMLSITYFIIGSIYKWAVLFDHFFIRVIFFPCKCCEIHMVMNEIFVIYSVTYEFIYSYWCYFEFI